MSNIGDLLSIVFVAFGAGLIGARPSWRGSGQGLALQYFGVVVHLLTAGAILGAVATALTAAGCVAILVADETAPLSLRDDRKSRPQETSVAQPGLAAETRSASSWSGSRKNEASDSRNPWFNLSVVGLAVVGAIALAVSRPLTGHLSSDAIFDILILAGVLFCLLGPPVRIATGLLLFMSAANVLLRAADSGVTSAETLLLAASPLAFALTVVRWKTTDGPIERLS